MRAKGKKFLWGLVAAIIAAVFAAGLGAGLLLEHYDESIGFEREAGRIAEILELAPGKFVADVRAGTGQWTVDMARRVGETGHVYATAGGDNRPPSELYASVAAAGLDNVTVITRTPGEQGRLPLGCCDAILLRGVYHHLREREGFTERLFDYLRPGGILAVIDFDTPTPDYESGHGVARTTVIDEFRDAGFVVERVIEDWEGDAYAVTFRRSS